MSIRKVLKFLVRPVLYGLAIGASIIGTINLYDYHLNKVKTPGIIKIHDIEVEAVCVLRKVLHVQYFGEVVRITVIDCNGEPVFLDLPHPKPSKGRPV